MTANHRDAIQELYRGFNGRDIDASTAHLGPGVDWQVDVRGPHLDGRAAVRQHWQRQWQDGEARMAPMRIEEGDDGRLHVRVDELVRDGAGNVLVNRQVEHVFTFAGAFIARMDMLEAEPEDEQEEDEEDADEADWATE